MRAASRPKRERSGISSHWLKRRQSGWLETGRQLDDKVAFEPQNRDIRGPIVVAAALERDLGLARKES